MNYAEHPITDLADCIAHAQYEGFSDIEYETRDWEEYRKTQKDVRIPARRRPTTREFGTTLVLHEPMDTMSKISMNVAHWGFVTDPTYPYRNYYGKVFTRSEVTCMWAFATTEEEIEYMKQWKLHQ